MHPGAQPNRADAAEVLGRHLADGMTIALTGGAGVWARHVARIIGRKGTILEFNAARTDAPDDSCDLVLWAEAWREPGEHRAALREARRILKEHGRLAILGGAGEAGPLVDALEREGWTVHELAGAAPGGYILIAAATDESVQS